jgi:hypothetical protein
MEELATLLTRELFAFGDISSQTFELDEILSVDLCLASAEETV